MRRDYVTLALFLSVPYAFIHAGIIHAGHLFFFMLSALVIVSLMQKNIWLSLFFIYAAGWQLLLFIDGLSLPPPERQRQIAKGFSQIVFLLAGISIYVAVLKTKLPNETFYNIICISAIAQCLLAVCQLWKHDPIIYLLSQFVEIKRGLGEDIIIGTLGNNNFLAAYLAFSLPFFFRAYWKYCVPLIIVLLFWSKTSAAVTSGFIGMAFYFGGGYLKIIIAIVMGILYAIILDKPFVEYEIQQVTPHKILNVYSSARFDIWIQAIKEIFDSWHICIFGHGPAARWAKPYPMHNEYLQVWHQFGLIGLSLMVGFIIDLSRRYIHFKTMMTKAENKILFASFVIVCINMIGNYPLHLAPSAFLIIIIVGLIGRTQCQKNTEC